MKWYVTAVAAVFSFSLMSQSMTLDANKSKMVIKGTSTIHDWESKVETINSTGAATKGETLTITSINLTVPVKSIKSGKSGMDKKTYEALKVKENPNITFTVSSPVSVKNGKASFKGKLNIAGHEKEVIIPTTVTENVSTVNVKGSISLKMSSFNMEPVTAMLGTIKAGDEIIVEFNLAYQLK